MRYTVNFFAQQMDEMHDVKPDVGVMGDGQVQGNTFDEKKDD